MKRPRFSRSLRGTWLGVRSGAGIGDLVGEQGHHGGEVGLLKALDQGCVDLFLNGLAARREGPLTVHPGQLVPDLRVDEGGEELLGNGLVGADEPSKAAGVLHLVNGLLLGLFSLVSSGLRLAEFLLGLFSPIFSGCKLLLQLLDPTLGRGDLLLKRHNLLLSDALYRAVDGGGVGDVDDGGIGGRLASGLLRAQGHLRLGARGGGRGNERSLGRHTCTNSNGLIRTAGLKGRSGRVRRILLGFRRPWLGSAVASPVAGTASDTGSYFSSRP
nr:hypothetical protein Iba_scaffold61000CG0010 [Ipomoea batatas]